VKRRICAGVHAALEVPPRAAYAARVPRLRAEIERSLAFIAEHLEQPLTVADVARAAGMSEFHFQRVFHDALSETVGQFVTRKRLETAALRLAYEPDTPITSIALSTGYSSSSNFSKAFNAFFGCSPTDVRSPAGKVPAAVGKVIARYGKRFRPEDLYSIADEENEQAWRTEASHWQALVRFEQSPGIDFACLSSPEGYDLPALEQTWGELIARARQLGLCQGDVDAWGVALDSPNLSAPDRCRYHACVPCPPGTRLPSPLFPGRLKPGRYAVFRYAGPVAGVSAAYRSIYSCWFRSSSVTPEDFEPLGHYVTDEPQGGMTDMEMWFRVRPRE
jgi:AraC family transcriptional regulator